MSRGRKILNSSIANNWEKAFFNSIGHYITLINSGLSKIFKNEPLSNHIKIFGGFAFKNSEYKSSGIPIIRISDFNNEKIILDGVVYYEESPMLEKYELEESDIIIALTGGTIGKLGIVQAGLGKLYLNQRVGKFVILNLDEFEKEYIYWIARGVEGIVKNLAWGAAIPNVSPKQIEELNFPIPTRDIQKNIIRFLNDLRNGNVNGNVYFNEEIESEIKNIQEKQVKTREVQDELSFQFAQLGNLNQAILQEAIQGKLVVQNPDDEPARELLKRIKVEKARSGKKEKTLTPIIPEEIPFDIPKNWVWCRLGEICSKIGSGSTPKGSNYAKSGFPFFRSQNIHNDGLVHDDIKFISNEVQIQMNGTKVLANDILLNITGGSMGRCALVPKDFEEGNVSQHVCIIRPIELDRNYFHKIVLSPYFQKFIFSSTTGAGREGLPKYNLERFVIPLPPLSEQKRIAAEIEKQFAKTKQLKEHIIANQQATEQLLKALLHQAFEAKEMVEEKPKGKAIELKPTNVDYYRRTVLSAEIVWQLHKEPTLGHLKLQKLIYLCQQSAEMQLPTNFLRQAMGPYDNRLMRSIDKQLKEKKWFEYNKTQVLKYQPLEKAGQHHNDFVKYFSAENESIQFIIDTFKTIKSDIVEIVATLYACINNIIDEKFIFSETLLIQRFYEWSEEKQKFSEKEVKRVFSRMKETGIIPKGFTI
ncbi:Restriction endonuclease S subunit [Paenimyroides ummariense]|uniref:Restriction endonuclease S subunit n=1 Tax=Paenimyroides ummariense TaxID=913024 RepID=A0A1I5FKH6_9FLAO|nr:restriction endonuclease subunit S [Paenimyroides ummariense]SFO24126.1 Restriction endonuclease S subunit [Paenimyroides ummariense]